MFILGISCYYHDAAAALLQDGILVAAAEEERFTRKKHDYSFPSHAIDFCLRQAGISGRDLDYVVFYEKPLLKFERILLTTLQTFPQSWAVFRESMITWFNDKLWIKGQLLTKLNIPDEKLLFVEHHLSHAASSFFCSPYDEAAILTIDGVGESAPRLHSEKPLRTGMEQAKSYRAVQRSKVPPFSWPSVFGVHSLPGFPGQ